MAPGLVPFLVYPSAMASDFELPMISLVDITDETIQGVAERTKRPVEAVRAYLKSDEQDNELLRAFLFFGVGPINKTFQ